ncbi:MAG TPA: DUF2726 domain-containing protein [Bacillota bacterium]|nr:DUF2726 domain-containing protein [Bacillota bacterium]
MSEKRGCLGFLFGGKKPQQDPGLPYRVRDDFLSDAEYSFFRVLRQIYGDRYYICPKIALKDIFYVLRPNENISFYNKIDRKHVDFLLYDLETRKPVLGIELDDRSHGRNDRQQRDVFVNEVFEAAGLPLARVTAAASYNLAELKRYFEEKLPAIRGEDSKEIPAGAGEVAAANETAASTADILCPKCGIPMVIRNSKRGQFYGCKNYPRCRETRDI